MDCRYLQFAFSDYRMKETAFMSLFDVENVDCVEQCLDSAEISNLI